MTRKKRKISKSPWRVEPIFGVFSHLVNEVEKSCQKCHFLCSTHQDDSESFVLSHSSSRYDFRCPTLRGARIFEPFLVVQICLHVERFMLSCFVSLTLKLTTHYADTLMIVVHFWMYLILCKHGINPRKLQFFMELFVKCTCIEVERILLMMLLSVQTSFLYLVYIIIVSL